MKLQSLILFWTLLTLSFTSMASQSECYIFEKQSAPEVDQIHDKVLKWTQQFEANHSPMYFDHGGKFSVDYYSTTISSFSVGRNR